MRPGEWRRHLAAEQDRAARAGRIWPRQRVTDIVMSAATEVDQNLTQWHRGDQATCPACLAEREPLKTLQTFQLSAHWWHG